MKRILKTYYTLGTVLLLTALLTACEQKDFEPNYNAAPGGGTLSTYKAYTLASTSAQGHLRAGGVLQIQRYRYAGADGPVQHRKRHHLSGVYLWRCAGDQLHYGPETTWRN